MTFLKNPTVFLQMRGNIAPVGRNGLRGKGAIDMRERPDWNGFVALRQGGRSYWWFTASACCKQEVLLNGTTVRSNVKLGKPITCPGCKVVHR